MHGKKVFFEESFIDIERQGLIKYRAWIIIKGKELLKIHKKILKFKPVW